MSSDKIGARHAFTTRYGGVSTGIFSSLNLGSNRGDDPEAVRENYRRVCELMGVGIDDCERISRRLDPILDEEDPIPDSYVFEVGSAGAERELKRPSDFEQFMGSQVEVKLYQPVKGSKTFVGKVTVTVGKERMTFEKAQTAQVKLHVTI